MQDQPKYEAYESSDFFDDGQASRPMVEGTVPRGAQYRDADAYIYTGKTDGAQAGAQATTQPATQATAQGGGAMSSAGGAATAGGAQQPGDVNVRGNVAGGIPGASEQARSATAGPDVFPFPITEADLNRGQERFNAYCSMCHGMAGDGDGLIVRRGFRRPPSFHSEQLQEGQSSASHFFDVISNGWGAMPDYSSMISVEDRWKIIAYVRALQLSRRARVEDVPVAERGKLEAAGGQQPAAEQPHGGPQH